MSRMHVDEASSWPLLERTERCHRRIEAQCRVLQQLQPCTPGDGQMAIAQSLLVCFDQALGEQRRDEEQVLFPAVVDSMAGSDAVCLRQMIEGLQDDHAALARLWDTLRAALAATAAGPAPEWPAEAAAAFAERWQRHIAREGGELLPMAARLVDADELARMENRARQPHRAAP